MASPPEDEGEVGEVRLHDGVEWMWIVDTWRRVGIDVRTPEGGRAPLREVDPAELLRRDDER